MDETDNDYDYSGVESDTYTNSSDGIDSDAEEMLLSHVYYTGDPGMQKTIAAKSSVKEQVTPLNSKQTFAPTSPSTAAVASNNSEEKTSLEEEEGEEEKDSIYKAKRSRRNPVDAISNDTSSNEPILLSGSSDDSDDNADIASTDKTRPTALGDTETKSSDDVRSESAYEPLRVARVVQLSPGGSAKVVVRNGDDNSGKDGSDDDYSDGDDLQTKGRYFLGPETESRACLRCMKRGHIAKDCTDTSCPACGSTNHEYQDCQFNGKVCHNCLESGHIARSCPRSRGGPPICCSQCGSFQHATRSCPSLWRVYVYVENQPIEPPQRVYCFNCAVMGHYGYQCPIQGPDRGMARAAVLQERTDYKRQRLLNNHSAPNHHHSRYAADTRAPTGDRRAPAAGYIRQPLPNHRSQHTSHPNPNWNNYRQAHHGQRPTAKRR